MATGSSFTDAVSESLQRSGVTSRTVSDQVSKSVSEGVSRTLTGGVSDSSQETASHSKSQERSWSETRDHARQQSAAYAERLGQMKSLVESTSFNDDTDMHSALNIVQGFQNEKLSMEARMNNLDLLKGFVGSHATQAQGNTGGPVSTAPIPKDGLGPALHMKKIANRTKAGTELSEAEKRLGAASNPNAKYDAASRGVPAKMANDNAARNQLAKQVRVTGALNMGGNLVKPKPTH